MREYNNNGCVVMLDGSPVLDFDVVEMITHSVPVTIVEYAVEGGSSIAQLGYREGARLDVTGFISAIAFGETDESASDDRDIKAWEMLNSLTSNMSIVRVVTLNDIYENMLITNIEKMEDVKTDGILSASVTFQQIKLGSIDRIDVPIEIILAASGARSGAVSTEDSGKKEGEEDGTERKSTAAKIADGIMSMFGK